MSKFKNNDAFAKNFKILLSRFPSISEGARMLGLNRQQVNKYLNGTSFPSVSTLQRIASFYDMEIDDLLLDTEEFNERSKDNSFSALRIPPELMRPIDALHSYAQGKTAFMQFFVGDYLVYTSNLHKDGEVIVSFSRIFQKDGVTYQKALSPQFRYGTKNGSHYVVKHEAIILEAGGRLHFMRFANIGLPVGSIGLKIMTPSVGAVHTYMQGYLLATERVQSGGLDKFPVVMKRTRSTSILKQVRQMCGPFSLTDPDLDPIVAQYFSDMLQTVNTQLPTANLSTH